MSGAVTLADCPHAIQRRVHVQFPRRGRRPSGWYCLDCGFDIATRDFELSARELGFFRAIRVHVEERKGGQCDAVEIAVAPIGEPA